LRYTLNKNEHSQSILPSSHCIYPQSACRKAALLIKKAKSVLQKIMSYHQSGEAYANPYDSGSPESSPESSHHTEFLDLTNGEGGEGQEDSYSDDDEDDDILDRGDEDDDDEADDASAALAEMAEESSATPPPPVVDDRPSTISINNTLGDAGHAAAMVSLSVPTLASTNTSSGGGGGKSVQHQPEALRDSLSTAASKGGGGGGGGRTLDLRTINPNTPGKVVETGQEHTGRWTKEEHEAFLSALRLYGKEWKKVAAKVKTRTVVQTRTHAQKYFQKLHKVVEGGGKEGDITHVDMGIAGTEHVPRKNSGQKKKRNAASIAAANTASAMAKPSQRQTSVTMAANVISNMSSTQQPSSLLLDASPGASASSSSYSISNPTSILNRSGQHALPLQLPVAGLPAADHGFSTGTEAPTTVASRSFPAMPYASAGFVTNGILNSSTAGNALGIEGGMGNPFSIKIMAPEHDSATKRGKFPEPSPAACGKRKLAEIAAARMLAGVASGGIGVGGAGPSSASRQPLLSTAMMEHRNHLSALQQQQQQHQPSDQQLGYFESDADGPATPPPEPAYTQSSLKPGRTVELKHMPAPPLVGNTTASSDQEVGVRKPFGLSLQIVNPETLGISHDRKRRRGPDGQGSPVTPWEGQLEALVRYVKRLRKKALGLCSS
jgi:SHAQKYF class myb-like DNA-binding protein